MDNQILTIIIGVVALLAGVGAGKFLFAKNTRRQVEEAELQTQKMIADAKSQAETLKKEKTAGSEGALCSARKRNTTGKSSTATARSTMQRARIKQKEQSINYQTGKPRQADQGKRNHQGKPEPPDRSH